MKKQFVGSHVIDAVITSRVQEVPGSLARYLDQKRWMGPMQRFYRSLKDLRIMALNVDFDERRV